MKKLDGVNAERCLREMQGIQHGRAGPTYPFNTAIKDGRRTRGLKINKIELGEHARRRRRSRPIGVTCGVTFSFGGLKIIDTVRGRGHGGPSRSRASIAAGELVGGIFYHNYPGGTGLTSGRGVRQDRRRRRRPRTPWAKPSARADDQSRPVSSSTIRIRTIDPTPSGWPIAPSRSCAAMSATHRSESGSVRSAVSVLMLSSTGRMPCRWAGRTKDHGLSSASEPCGRPRWLLCGRRRRVGRIHNALPREHGPRSRRRRRASVTATNGRRRPRYDHLRRRRTRTVSSPH